MSVVITVHGESESWHSAERGIVHLAVALDGPHRERVFSRALHSSDAVRELIVPLAATNGPISRWTSDSVRVTSQRPWNNEGEQLPLVFAASIDFSVRFREFDALTNFIELVGEIDHIAVNYVEWELTDDTTTRAKTEARGRAVIDAQTKAREYAASLGLGTVTATAIADSGMLGVSAAADDSSTIMGSASMRMSSTGKGGSSLSLKPEKISVASRIDARFNAS
ncbi:hypothetical protein A20C1_00440 [marine actinobacterium PHSC20C1]|nr:hypothetical protein A20C1_00440 [marine actinobacterium PHSC20C1]